MDERRVQFQVLFPESIDYRPESVIKRLCLRSKEAVIVRLLAMVFNEVDH